MSTPASGPALAARDRRWVDSGDGPALEYFVAGRGGLPLICINAHGQGLLVWSELVEHFAQRRRIICWKPRGTCHTAARPHTLFDQVADLERIVEAERVSECQLVTWCSGAKVGIEFARCKPIVSALVLTNGTFAKLPGLEHLETPFEQVLFELCKAVARQPTLATTLMNSMRALLLGSPIGARGAARQEGNGGTACQDPDLKAMIVEPFESKQSTSNYSVQVVDYLSHNIAPALAATRIPALVLSGERDRISSPRMANAVAERMPNACYCEIPGGSHYCLYEKPRAVIEILERFCEAPDAFHALSKSKEMVLR